MKTKIIYTILLLTILLITTISILKEKNYPKQEIISNNQFDKTYEEIKSSKNYQNNLSDEYYQEYYTLKQNNIFNNQQLINITLNSINYPQFLNSYNDTKNYLIIDNIPLVNRTYGLNEKFIPDNLIEIEGVNYIKRPNEKMLINQQVLLAYQKLYQEAKTKDIELVIFSAYRSYQKQLSLWQNSLNTNDPYLALPGHSEHQTGLAIDVSTKDIGLTNNFLNTSAYAFLKENAYKFGFIFRYIKNKEDITGYNQEAWHLRYVGDIAEEINRTNLTLEEYLFYYYEIPIN